jgi:hypothetical protein
MQVDRTTYRSPNYNDRPAGTAIKALTLHTTEGPWDSDARWLCNPDSDVSAHYTLDDAGGIYLLVDEENRAWHAGESYYAGLYDYNDFSIGIEVSHQQGETYTIAQLGALDQLCIDIIKRYKIPAEMVVKHAWIATPYGRKIDPTNWSDAQFIEWRTALYATQPPVDPLRVRQIQGVDRLYYCGVGFYDLYTQKNGFWWGGYPKCDETRSKNKQNRDCTYMDFERFCLTYNSQEGVRTALDQDAHDLGWKR